MRERVGRTAHNERFSVSILFKANELCVINRPGMIGAAGFTGYAGNLPHVGM